MSGFDDVCVCVCVCSGDGDGDGPNDDSDVDDDAIAPSVRQIMHLSALHMQSILYALGGGSGAYNHAHKSEFIQWPTAGEQAHACVRVCMSNALVRLSVRLCVG